MTKRICSCFGAAARSASKAVLADEKRIHPMHHAHRPFVTPPGNGLTLPAPLYRPGCSSARSAAMRIFLTLLFGLTTPILFHPAPATAQTSSIRVTEPFARAAPAGRATAAYMSIQGGPDRLTSASSDVAGQVELRETTVEGGVLSTRPVGGALINPGVATRLAPGGLHIVLINLKRALKDGDTVTLTLTFERAGRVTVPVPIARNAAAAQPNAAVPGLLGSTR